jgi:hypothetical protein
MPASREAEEKASLDIGMKSDEGCLSSHNTLCSRTEGCRHPKEREVSNVCRVTDP